MAVIFVLALNAGPDRAAAEEVAGQLTDLRPLPAGRYRVPLLPPGIRVMVGDDGVEYQEVSVVAAGLGDYWIAHSGEGSEWLDLDEEELEKVTRGMYELLRRCRGYRAAIVGWNAEHAVDLGELAEDSAEDWLPGGPRDGLVLSEEALAQLGVPATVEPFAPGYSWLPYRAR